MDFFILINNNLINKSSCPSKDSFDVDALDKSSVKLREYEDTDVTWSLKYIGVSISLERVNKIIKNGPPTNK